VPRCSARPRHARDSWCRGFTGFPLETATPGLGRCDLASAWRLDYRAGSSEKLDIYRQIASEMVVWWAGRPDSLEAQPVQYWKWRPCEKPADHYTKLILVRAGNWSGNGVTRSRGPDGNSCAKCWQAEASASHIIKYRRKS
jgi:hypothetical protein